MKKALWFLLSLKGRVSRVPFALFVIGILLLLPLIYRAIIYSGLALEGIWLIGVPPLLALWPLYAMTAKRLHDINRTGLWAIPVLLTPALLIILSLYLGQSLATGTLPQKQYEDILIWVRVTGNVYVYIMYFILILWPGTKGPNRFGSSPREKPHSLLRRPNNHL